MVRLHEWNGNGLVGTEAKGEEMQRLWRQVHAYAPTAISVFSYVRCKGSPNAQNEAGAQGITRGKATYQDKSRMAQGGSK